MLLWMILIQAIATLGSIFACVAGFEHCHSIAIAKDVLGALFGLPSLIFLLLLPLRFPYRGQSCVGVWL